MELDRIRAHLTAKPRDLLLFELALQTEVSVQNLLRLKVKDVKNLKIGDELPRPRPSGKLESHSVVNHEIYHAINKFLKETRPLDNDYLFKSRKGNKALSVPSVSRIIRAWREETGLNNFNGLPGLRLAQRKSRETNKPAVDANIEKPQKVLPKVQNLTIQEKVYRELEKAILSGKIPPGQKLVAEEIARMMDVSRIPVREAMGRLEARGIVTNRPKWGRVVNELSRENLKEILELRLLLEPKAASKAALQATNEFLSLLEQAHTAFAKARTVSDTSHLLQTNRDYHFLIYKQANSPMLLDIISQLWDKVSPYYHIMFHQSLLPSPSIGIEYHEQILNSMMNRNGEEVKRCLTADLTDSAKFILELFDAYKKNGNLNQL